MRCVPSDPGSDPRWVMQALLAARDPSVVEAQYRNLRTRIEEQTRANAAARSWAPQVNRAE